MTRAMIPALALLTLAPGCFRTVYTVGPAPLTTEPTLVQSHPRYLFGVMETEPLRPQETCGDAGFAQLQLSWRPKNVILNGVTLGAFSPATAALWCAEAPPMAP